jgi:hypothetical protein
VPYVVTLEGFAPPPRADGVAFTGARIEEAVAPTGPWAPLETLPVEPYDAEAPVPADYTTTQATLEVGWYRVAFTDPGGGVALSGAVRHPAVDTSAGVPLLGTVDELRRYLNTPAGGRGADDALLEALLAAASDRIAQARPERTLAPIPATDADPPVARRFRVLGRTVQVPDLRRVDEVALVFAGTRSPVTGYDLDRRGDRPALYLRLPYAHPGATIEVVGWWGPTVVEPMVRHAALVWAARAWHERTGRYADAVQDPAGGAASYFRQVPAEVAGTLAVLAVPGV